MPILLVFLILLLAGPGWGKRPSDQLSQRWMAWFAGQDVQISPKPVPSVLDHEIRTRTISTVPVAPLNMRDILLPDRPPSPAMLGSTFRLTDAFSMPPDAAADGGATMALSHRPHDSAGDDGAMRHAGLMRTPTGPASSFGQSHALKDMWGEWKHRLNAERRFTGSSGTDAEVSALPVRGEQQSRRVGLSWSQAAFPKVDVSYSRNAFSSTLDPLGLTPQLKNHQMVEAAMGYAGAAWNARLASSYSLETDLLSHGENQVKTQTMTLTFRPFEVLTIAPTFGYRAEQQELSGMRIDSPSFSLAMKYQQSQQFLFTALGNYSGMRSSDGHLDLETVGGRGILTWNVQQSRHWTTVLFVEGGYNRQTNLLMPTAQMEDLSGVLRLVLSPL